MSRKGEGIPDDRQTLLAGLAIDFNVEQEHWTVGAKWRGRRIGHIHASCNGDSLLIGDIQNHGRISETQRSILTVMKPIYSHREADPNRRAIPMREQRDDGEDGHV